MVWCKELLLVTVLSNFLKIDGEVQQVIKKLRMVSWQRKAEDFEMMKLLTITSVQKSQGKRVGYS